MIVQRKYTAPGRHPTENCVALFVNCSLLLCNSLINRSKKFITGMRISRQIMLMFFPFFVLYGFVLILSHLTLYEWKFITDYTYAYNSEILEGVIKSEDNIIIDKVNTAIHSNLDSNFQILLFNKIYLKELLAHDFMNGHSMTGVSESSENLFSMLDGTNYDYAINRQEAYEQIDSEQLTYGWNTKYREFTKMFYLNLPLFIQTELLKDIPFVSGYFIVYPVSNKQGYLHYFQYPLPKNYEKVKNINFSPSNIISDPYPNGNDVQDDVNSLKNCSWLIPMDKDFVQNVKFTHQKSQLKVVHSVEMKETNRNEYYYASVLFLQEILGHDYIFEIILKYLKSPVGTFDYEYFSFLNTNSTYIDYSQYNNIDNKFTDNSTLVISSNPTTTLVSSGIFTSYFSFGMERIDGKLLQISNNIDTVDMMVFNQLESFYKVNKQFKEDLFLFKTLYMYNSFYLKSLEMNNASYIPESDDVFFIVVNNNTQIINEVCSLLSLEYYYTNFSDYSTCFNDDEIYYYAKYHNIPDFESMNYPTYPLCECLPFYCLNLTLPDPLSQIKKKNFAERLFLPKDCRTKLNSYRQSSSADSPGHDRVRFQRNIRPMEFDRNMSMFNAFMIFDTDCNKLLEDFSAELKELISMLVIIYSVGMVVVILVISIRMFCKLDRVGVIVKKFVEVQEKHLFINEKSTRGDTPESMKNIKNKRRCGIGQPRRLFGLENKSPGGLGTIESIENENDQKPSKSKGVKEKEKENSSLLDIQASGESNKDSSHDSPDESMSKGKNQEDSKIEIPSENISSNPSENSLTEELKKILNPPSAKRNSFLLNLPFRNRSDLLNILNEKISLKTNKTLNGRNELWELLEYISKKTPLFKINLSTDINFYENDPMIKSYKQLIEKQNKFLSQGESIEKDFSRKILYEVLSTELVQFTGMSYNFSFKYIENNNVDYYTINNNLTSHSMLDKRSSAIEIWVSKIQTKLKLVEKRSPFDLLNDFFESSLESDDGMDVYKISCLKSVINYYLECIQWPLMKLIYEENIKNNFEKLESE